MIHAHAPYGFFSKYHTSHSLISRETIFAHNHDAVGLVFTILYSLPLMISLSCTLSI